MTGSAEIIRGDARHLPLADDSVDLVVTSPPYFALRSYQDCGEHYAGQIGDEATPAEFVAALLEVTAECVRVLKPSGSLWVNLGDKYSQRVATRPSSHQDGLFPDREDLPKDWKRDKALGLTRMPYQNVVNPQTGQYVREKSLMGIPWRYALACIDDLGLILRAEVIWSKPNGLPESVTDRVRRSHEQWFHFTLEPRYFSAVDEIREQYAPDTAKRYEGGYNHTKTGAARQSVNVDYSGTIYATNPLGKLPGSVWTIATEPLRVPDELGIDHFAAFPTEWPKRLVKGFCPEGGVVLDPFGGTGTTALVAKALGRHGISVDMSADYCRLAEWRTNDPAQLAKVQGRPKPKPVPAGQDTFDLLEGFA
jgi:site-specific DNA-methyltransferase (cytosine-N4-specific)